jgi:hypothetical protein
MDPKLWLLFCVYIACFVGMIFYFDIKNAYANATAFMTIYMWIALTIKTMYFEYSDGVECQKTYSHELAQPMVVSIQSFGVGISNVIWFFSFTWVVELINSFFKFCGWKDHELNGPFYIGLVWRVCKLNLLQYTKQIGKQGYDAKTCISNLLWLAIPVCLLRFIPCWYLCIPWLQKQMYMLLNLNIIFLSKPEYEKWVFSPFSYSFSGNSSASQNGHQGLTAGKMEVEGYLLKYKVTEFKYINDDYNLNKPTTFIDIPWRKGSQDKTLVALLSKHVTYLDGQKITLENFGKFMEEKHKIYSKKTTSTFNPISAFAKEVLLQMKIAQAPK